MKFESWCDRGIGSSTFVEVMRTGFPTGRCWSVVGPLVAAGVISGGSWSMIAAPGIGANIGGAMAVMVGTPAVVILVLIAAFSGVRLLIGRRSVPEPGP